MMLSSVPLLEHLQALAQQIAASPKQTAALVAALQGQSAARALATRLEASRQVCAMATTVGYLKAQVVPYDGLGTAVDSISELILRGQRSIVLAELDALRDLAADASTSGQWFALAFSPFAEVSDWISYVGHEVNGIAQWWLDYRGQADDRAEYRAALGKAHAAMRALAYRSKATPFLLEASVRADWPELQAPCSRISAALAIPIDIDLAMPVLAIAPHSSGHAAERPS